MSVTAYCTMLWRYKNILNYKKTSGKQPCPSWLSLVFSIPHKITNRRVYLLALLQIWDDRSGVSEHGACVQLHLKQCTVGVNFFLHLQYIPRYIPTCKQFGIVCLVLQTSCPTSAGRVTCGFSDGDREKMQLTSLKPSNIKTDKTML